MMSVAEVSQQIEELVNQSLRDGLLDDQFVQLMQLEDESNPDFVSEVVHLYFEDSGSKLAKLDARLSDPSPADFNEVDAVVHQFKGSSASFGAAAMAALCVSLRDAAAARDAGACRALVSQLRESYAALRERLGAFSRLEATKKQLLRGGGSS